MPAFYKMQAHTIFFNFYEPEIIRRQITEDLEPFYSDKTKNLIFATSAKVYPYLNQIVSVRIILAKFSKILEEDINVPAELEVYKKTKDLDPTKLVEEEVDSDEEEDQPLLNKEESTKVEGDKSAAPETNKPKEIELITIEKK